MKVVTQQADRRRALAYGTIIIVTKKTARNNFSKLGDAASNCGEQPAAVGGEGWESWRSKLRKRLLRA